MKSKYILFVIVLVLIGFGAYLLYSTSNNSGNKVINNSASINDTSDISSDQGEQVELQSGRYISYKSGVLEENKDKKRVLYFYANWCPTCLPVDKEFRENSDKIPEGVVVIRINYNDSDTDSEEKSLASNYGVTYQHTFVQIDQYGNEILKYNGGNLNTLLSKLK